MKFRKISTHEFCVTDALGLVADCLHREPHFGFVRFLSQNSLHSKFFHSRSQPAARNFCSFFSRSQRVVQNFSIAVHSQPLEIFVLLLAVHSEPFKIIP